MKAATLDKLKEMAKAGQCRLLYLDETGFCASPPVQRGWSPVGQPHCIVPLTHCRRSVLGAFDFAANTLHHRVTAQSIKRGTVTEFVEQLVELPDERVTVIVLDNASIHHGIDQAILHRWLVEHKTLLFYLPPYSPELNVIEMVWRHAKYHWRRFVNWSRESIDAEIEQLLSEYGNKYQMCFS